MTAEKPWLDAKPGEKWVIHGPVEEALNLDELTRWTNYGRGEAGAWIKREESFDGMIAECYDDRSDDGDRVFTVSSMHDRYLVPAPAIRSASRVILVDASDPRRAVSAHEQGALDEAFKGMES